MFCITLTFRLIHVGPAIRQEILKHTMNSIEQMSPTRGRRLIITDDLDTALIQTRGRNNNNVQVIMIDIDEQTQKVRLFKKVLIIPLAHVNLFNEISNILKTWR